MKRAAILSASLMALACSSAKTGGSVSGTVTNASGAAVTFSPLGEADSIVYLDTRCNNVSTSAVLVAFSTRAGLCAALDESDALASSSVLLVEVLATPASSVGDAPQIPNGTYAIGTPSHDNNGDTFTAAVYLVSYDGTCGTEQTAAASGNVVINSSAGQEVDGTFTADFGGAGSFTGTFAAPTCTLSDNMTCDLGQSSGCQP